MLLQPPSRPPMARAPLFRPPSWTNPIRAAAATPAAITVAGGHSQHVWAISLSTSTSAVAATRLERRAVLPEWTEEASSAALFHLLRKSV